MRWYDKIDATWGRPPNSLLDLTGSVTDSPALSARGARAGAGYIPQSLECSKSCAASAAARLTGG
jgi:hypothetical protein